MTDTEREAAINALYDLWLERKASYESWIELIKERSQEQIEKMEREQHLC